MRLRAMGSFEQVEETTLEYTPTWIVAVVGSIFVVVSLLLERCIHRLRKVSECFYLDYSYLVVDEQIISVMHTERLIGDIHVM